MSTVSNMMISTIVDEPGEKRLLDVLNSAKLTSRGNGPNFINISKNVGGNKHLEADIFAGAFNYLDKAAFVNLIGRLKRKFTKEFDYLFIDDLQIFYKGQEDENWTIYSIQDNLDEIL